MSSMARIAAVTYENTTQPPGPERAQALARLHRIRRSAYITERREAIAEAIAAGLTQDEIAEVLEMSESTVRVDLRRHSRRRANEAGASTETSTS